MSLSPLMFQSQPPASLSEQINKQGREEPRMKCGEMKAALIDVSPGLLCRDGASSIFQGIKLCQPRMALNMECIRRGGGGVERRWLGGGGISLTH